MVVVTSFEKYFKALLLLLNQGVNEQGHNILMLKTSLESIFCSYKFEVFFNPGLHESAWIKNEENFIRKIFTAGMAESRYMMSGYINQTQDIIKSDQLIYRVRSLLVYVMQYPENDRYSEIKFEDTQFFEEYAPLFGLSNGEIESTIMGKKGDALQSSFLCMNTLFAPKVYGQSFSSTFHAVSHPLYLEIAILQSPNSSRSEKILAAATINWFIEKVTITNPHKAELREIAANAE